MDPEKAAIDALVSQLNAGGAVLGGPQGNAFFTDIERVGDCLTADLTYYGGTFVIRIESLENALAR